MEAVSKNSSMLKRTMTLGMCRAFVVAALVLLVGCDSGRPTPRLGLGAFQPAINKGNLASGQTSNTRGSGRRQQGPEATTPDPKAEPPAEEEAETEEPEEPGEEVEEPTAEELAAQKEKDAKLAKLKADLSRRLVVAAGDSSSGESTPEERVEETEIIVPVVVVEPEGPKWLPSYKRCGSSIYGDKDVEDALRKPPGDGSSIKGQTVDLQKRLVACKIDITEDCTAESCTMWLVIMDEDGQNLEKVGCTYQMGEADNIPANSFASSMMANIRQGDKKWLTWSDGHSSSYASMQETAKSSGCNIK